MIVGTEWMVDAAECDPDRLRDLGAMRSLLERVVARLDLTVVGEGRWHAFPGAGGVTGMLLLAESHLTCHTYPEYRTASINLYCCRPRPALDWEALLADALGAARVRVQFVERGVTGAAVGVVSPAAHATRAEAERR